MGQLSWPEPHRAKPHIQKDILSSRIHHAQIIDMIKNFFTVLFTGDQEKLLGLPVSPFCDRSHPGISKSQVCFKADYHPPARKNAKLLLFA